MSSSGEPQEMRVKLVYFAWVRDLPDAIVTVADLVRWLKGHGEEYAYAFENEAVVRVAVDRTHVKPDSPIAGAREIAFFPPMTGG